MTNTNKKSKNTRKLLGAVGMLSVSAAMLVSSTFAWFTMNKTVTAANMSVQAKAEGGLLISETSAATSEWDNIANTTADVTAAKVALYPTSTANGSTWYHATSKTANNAGNATAANSASTLKADGYTSLTLTSNELQAAASGTHGKKEVYYTDSGTEGYDTDDAKYYVKYTYYLKTSTEGATALGLDKGNQNVAITQVTVEPPASSVSTDLNKSLRIGIAIDGRFYIFAPVEGATGTYWVAAGAKSTTAIDSHSSATANNMQIPTGLTSIAGVKGTPTEVNVYMWFEGEDVNCKSDNITATLDELTATVEFSLVTLSAEATDAGVSMS
jgi:hypothetical protein